MARSQSCLPPSSSVPIHTILGALAFGNAPIPPSSRLSLSSKISLLFGSSDLPRSCRNVKRVSVDARIERSFTFADFFSLGIK